MEKQTILSIEDFNTYIRKLPSKETCAFMIDWAAPLCECDFICPYKGKDEYTFKGVQKRECTREKVLMQKRLLGLRI